MSENDYKTMNEVIDKLERFSNLLETRTQRKKRVIKKYSRKKGQDRIANFMTKGLGFNLNESVSFARPPELQRKVMKKSTDRLWKDWQTRVIGFNKMNRDLDKLANSLNAIKSFENIGKGRKGKSLARKGIKTFIDNIRTEVRIKRNFILYGCQIGSRRQLFARVSSCMVLEVSHAEDFTEITWENVPADRF